MPIKIQRKRNTSYTVRTFWFILTEMLPPRKGLKSRRPNRRCGYHFWLAVGQNGPKFRPILSPIPLLCVDDQQPLFSQLLSFQKIVLTETSLPLKRALAENLLSHQQESKTDLVIDGKNNFDFPISPQLTQQQHTHTQNIIVVYLVTRRSFRIKFSLPWWWIPWHCLWFRNLWQESKSPIVRDVMRYRSKR